MLHIQRVTDKQTGNHLRRLRLSKGIRADYVAEQLGVTKAMVALLESGRRTWTERYVADYKKAIGAICSTTHKI